MESSSRSKNILDRIVEARRASETRASRRRAENGGGKESRAAARFSGGARAGWQNQYYFGIEKSFAFARRDSRGVRSGGTGGESGGSRRGCLVRAHRRGFLFRLAGRPERSQQRYEDSDFTQGFHRGSLASMGNARGGCRFVSADCCGAERRGAARFAGSGAHAENGSAGGSAFTRGIAARSGRWRAHHWRE